MIYTKTLLISGVLALLAAGCKTTVSSSKSSKNIELLSQSDLGGEKARHCNKVGSFEVAKHESEVTETKQSVLEIKARNQAPRMDATHVLVWPAATYNCNKALEEVEGEADQCERSSVDAYTCVIGRRTF